MPIRDLTPDELNMVDQQATAPAPMQGAVQQQGPDPFSNFAQGFGNEFPQQVTSGLINTAEPQNPDFWTRAGQFGGAVAGGLPYALGGAYAGGALGAPFGPPGMAIGALLGGAGAVAANAAGRDVRSQLDEGRSMNQLNLGRTAATGIGAGVGQAIPVGGGTLVQQLIRNALLQGGVNAATDAGVQLAETGSVSDPWAVLRAGGMGAGFGAGGAYYGGAKTRTPAAPLTGGFDPLSQAMQGLDTPAQPAQPPVAQPYPATGYAGQGVGYQEAPRIIRPEDVLTNQTITDPRFLLANPQSPEGFYRRPGLGQDVVGPYANIYGPQPVSFPQVAPGTALPAGRQPAGLLPSGITPPAQPPQSYNVADYWHLMSPEAQQAYLLQNRQALQGQVVDYAPAPLELDPNTQALMAQMQAQEIAAQNQQAAQNAGLMAQQFRRQDLQAASQYPGFDWDPEVQQIVRQHQAQNAMGRFNQGQVQLDEQQAVNDLDAWMRQQEQLRAQAAAQAQRNPLQGYIEYQDDPEVQQIIEQITAAEQSLTDRQRLEAARMAAQQQTDNQAALDYQPEPRPAKRSDLQRPKT